MAKPCEYCGTEFEPKYPTQKFCKRKCYLDFRKNPKEVEFMDAVILVEEGEPIVTTHEKSDEEINIKVNEDAMIDLEEDSNEEKAEKAKALNKKLFPEGFCPICNSPIYCGRCVRFTQHNKLNK